MCTYWFPMRTWVLRDESIVLWILTHHVVQGVNVNSVTWELNNCINKERHRSVLNASWSRLVACLFACNFSISFLKWKSQSSHWVKSMTESMNTTFKVSNPKSNQQRNSTCLHSADVSGIFPVSATWSWGESLKSTQFLGSKNHYYHHLIFNFRAKACEHIEFTTVS